MSYWDSYFDECMKRYHRAKVPIWTRNQRHSLGTGTNEKAVRRNVEEAIWPRPFESLKELVGEYKTPEGGKVQEIGPIVYGYSVTSGPGGEPREREFGNIKKLGGGIAGRKLTA